MARAGIVTKTYVLMLRREAKQVQFYRTGRAAVSDQPAKKARDWIKGGDPPDGGDDDGETPYWRPHPGNGIYVPQGYERMMDDVPKNAESLNQAYRLRCDDGALEKPDCPAFDDPPHLP